MSHTSVFSSLTSDPAYLPQASERSALWADQDFLCHGMCYHSLKFFFFFALKRKLKKKITKKLGMADVMKHRHLPFNIWFFHPVVFGIIVQYKVA